MSRETDIIEQQIGVLAHRKLGLLEEQRALRQKLKHVETELRAAEGIAAGLRIARDAVKAAEPKDEPPQEPGE